MKKRDPLLLSVGGHVRSIRLAKGISQEDLAARAGLHRTYVGGVERGERNVSLINLAKIAAALEVTLPALVTVAAVRRSSDAGE
jgi:transcriptional regulator with XRE-family HTH domain